MKLCLAFHCLCESYEQASQSGRELFVSLDDMSQMIEEMLRRGYLFTPLDDPAPKTVTITFDDGYYNNLLFKDLAQRYDIPYLVFISSYYAQSGQGYPWLEVDGASYEGMHDFDYYEHFALNEDDSSRQLNPASGDQRPMDYDDLKNMLGDGLSEIGCHGYYHQPLSEKYQERIQSERDLGFNVLRENLDISPRYYALANGMYTRPVIKQLLDTFDKVLTIDGRPFGKRQRVVHRMTLINPQIAGPLVGQIDKNLNPARQLKRAVRIMRKLGPASTVRGLVAGIRP